MSTATAKNGILGLVESARKAKSPIVGIPLIGMAPFAVKRELLVKTLEGLTVIDAAVQMNLEGQAAMLVIYAVGERVQAIRKFLPLQMPAYQAKGMIRDWAEKQRAKRSAPKVKQTAHAKQIAKLEKYLAKIGEVEAPKHPLLFGISYGHSRAESIREYDAKQLRAVAEMRAEGSAVEYLTKGQEWAEWKRQAHIRRWVQSQARLCAKGKMNSIQFYAILAERGVKVTKWSDVGSYERKHNGLTDVYAYLSKLWEFCHLQRKPWGFEPERVEEWSDLPGAKHYEHWLSRIRNRKELQGQIAAIRLLEAEAAEVKATKTAKRKPCRSVSVPFIPAVAVNATTIGTSEGARQ